MSVQLNVYGFHDDVTGTLVLTVHDPNAQVALDGVKFYVTDGSGVRSAAQNPDRTPSAGVYEKDVLLSVSNETLIEPEVTLTDGSKLTPGAESFPRTTGMAVTLVQGTQSERGSSVEIGSGLTLGRTSDGKRPVLTASGGAGALYVQDTDTAATAAGTLLFQGNVVSVDASGVAAFNLDGRYAALSHAHDASAITSGTLADARLSANIALKNANNLFSVSQIYANMVTLQAYTASGVLEGFLWPRWSDNATYFNYGAGGWYIRDNGSNVRVFLSAGGNVGIGTTAPDAKLHVAGNAYVSGVLAAGNRIYAGYDSGQASSVSCSNWFRSSGATGWYNASYGGGIWMQNSTWVEVYGGKSFAVPGTFQAGGRIRYGGGVGTDNTWGLFFDSGESMAYAIFRDPGAWTHPYPDLCINFHTGIRLGAHTSYGGIRFYADYYIAGSHHPAELMSVGNGDSHVRISNNLYVNGDSYNGYGHRMAAVTWGNGGPGTSRPGTLHVQY